jgi:glycosyltransferase involved in cell wall biosynthesis
VTAVLIIPALNEARALRQVLREIPAGVFGEIVVVDNGSTDGTAEIAAGAGARVVVEKRRGYGSACLAGVAALPKDADVVVFMDADGSDLPSDAGALIGPIVRDEADLVIGSRELGVPEPGSLSPHQRLGNRLAVWLVSLLYGRRYTDLGPFRAIRRTALERLDMRDKNFGWTIEMQVKAVRRGLRIVEAPVAYRNRKAGQSKISGSLVGSAAAGAKILWTVARYAIRNDPT